MKMAFFLLLAVTAQTLENVIQKRYDLNADPHKLSLWMYSLMLAVSALPVFLLQLRGDLYFDAQTLLYGAVFAGCYFAAMLFTIKAVGEGSLALTALFLSYSLVIPAAIGVLLLHEELTLIHIVGFLLLLVSLYFVGRPGGQVRITGKWVLYIAVAVFGNGLCVASQKMYLVHSGGRGRALFMITALTMIITALAVICACKKGFSRLTLRNGAPLAVLYGVANGLMNTFVMLLAAYPASVVFPTISGGGIILTYLISRFVYKERLSSDQNIGFVIGVLAVITLNL